MRSLFALFIVFITLLGGFSPLAAQDIGESGQPLPRFISVSAKEAYMRTGPGRQYPILWVYKRRNLPLKVIDEYGPWRQVLDYENISGWMHVSLLSSKRTAIILAGPQTLRSKPALSASPNARIEAGVVVKIEACQGNWCKLTHDDPSVTGWMPRAAIFGVFDDEDMD